MSKRSDPEGTSVPLLRKLDCYSLPVGDLDAAIAFYEGLGHRLAWRDGTHAAALRLPDCDAEIVLHAGDRPAETDLLVESVPRTIERFVSAGGKLVTGPVEIQVGLYAALRNPWNNPLTILDFSKGMLKTDPEGNVTGDRDPESRPDGELLSSSGR